MKKNNEVRSVPARKTAGDEGREVAADAPTLSPDGFCFEGTGKLLVDFKHKCDMIRLTFQRE